MTQLSSAYLSFYELSFSSTRKVISPLEAFVPSVKDMDLSSYAENCSSNKNVIATVEGHSVVAYTPALMGCDSLPWTWEQPFEEAEKSVVKK